MLPFILLDGINQQRLEDWVVRGNQQRLEDWVVRGNQQRLEDW